MKVFALFAMVAIYLLLILTWYEISKSECVVCVIS